MIGRNLLLPMTTGRKYLLGAVCAALAVPVVAGLAWATQAPAKAELPEATMTLPRFDFASVAPSNPSPQKRKAGMFADPGGAVRAQSLTLGAMIWYAFDLQPFQVVGGPEWIHKDQFDLIARPSASSQSVGLNSQGPSNPLTEKQQQMLQSLLITRFQLAFHREDKMGCVFVLEKGNGRPKLRSPKDSDSAPWVGSNMGTGINGDGLVGKNISMPVLAARLSRYLQCPVVD